MKNKPIPYSGVLQESFIYDHTIRTRILYVVVLVVFGIMILLLPLVKIDISFRAGGMILPDDTGMPGMAKGPCTEKMPGMEKAPDRVMAPGMAKTPGMVKTPGMASLQPRSLMAEIYIPSKDIARIYMGQKVQLQVDAYNYYHWGTLRGEVVSISDDFLLTDKGSVFKVRCRPEKDYFASMSGNRLPIRSGMTVNARFLTAKRSLFQWLCLR